jgi:LAO/AO transport system kinase
MNNEFLDSLRGGSFRTLARAITLVENDLPGSGELLCGLERSGETRVTGITGPPGAGKSTLVNALISEWTSQNKKVAVIAVDPSSPFNFGSLLGDRIRMHAHYNNPNVFIRSLATRGSLGGLNTRIVEITDVTKEAGFDHIIVETVGVGQSEVEIAGLADCTVVVLVPEAGDEVQTLKSGILEIADLFVVNKSDREGAELFLRNLRMMVHERNREKETPVLKTIAHEFSGISELARAIEVLLGESQTTTEKKVQLLAEKSYQLIQNRKMIHLNRKVLAEAIREQIKTEGFNLYQFCSTYI